MRKLLMAVALFAIAPSVQADIVLGEYAGPGVYDVTYTGGDTRTYTGSCKVAFNIDKTDARFAIEFSAFECGFDYFNDPVFIFSVRDGKLFSGQAQVGQVNADGSVDFTASSTVTKTSTEMTYNSDCTIRSVDKKSFNLARRISYHVTPSGPGGYRVIRQASADELQMVPRKDWPSCRVEMKAVIVSKAVRIDATLSK